MTNRISVVMPEDLEAQVRELAGGNMSAYILDAVRARVERDRKIRAYHASIGGAPELGDTAEDRAALERIRGFLQLPESA
jgi:Arc/MetJ-type ribon-helix-helix transcriptional regulator